MFDVVLVTDKEIRALNRRWFKRNSPTDVIAFAHGEIYISIDTAKRQAKERGINLHLELLRLMIHGAMHIEGCDDTNLKDFCRMRESEWAMLIKCI